MPFVIENDKSVNPIDIRFFCTVTEVVRPNDFPDLIQKLRTFHPYHIINANKMF